MGRFPVGIRLDVGLGVMDVVRGVLGYWVAGLLKRNEFYETDNVTIDHENDTDDSDIDEIDVGKSDKEKFIDKTYNSSSTPGNSIIGNKGLSYYEQIRLNIIQEREKMIAESGKKESNEESKRECIGGKKRGNILNIRGGKRQQISH